MSQPQQPRRVLATAFATPTERRLALGTLFRTIGRGLTVSVAVVYFTHHRDLPDLGVGWALTIAAVCGLLAGLGVGRVIDRVGPVRATVSFASIEAVLIGAYCIVGSIPLLILIAGFVSVSEASALASRSALIAVAITRERRVPVRARLRVITNIGWSLGAGAAAVPLGLGLEIGYIATFLTAGLFMGVSAIVTASIRLTPSAIDSRASVEAPSPRAALRNRPYVLLATINGVFCFHDGILSIGIPIWVLASTRAPASMVAWLLVTNTLIVTVTQIRASRSVVDPKSASQAQRRAALLLAIACVAYGATAGLSSVWAIVLLIAAAVVHAIGEVQQSAAAWLLAYDLAPDHSHGQYQALFGMGLSAANVVAPVALVFAVTALGPLGWVILAGVFLAAGIATGPVVRWAETRLAAPA